MNCNLCEEALIATISNKPPDLDPSKTYDFNIIRKEYNKEYGSKFLTEEGFIRAMIEARDIEETAKLINVPVCVISARFKKTQAKAYKRISYHGGRLPWEEIKEAYTIENGIPFRNLKHFMEHLLRKHGNTIAVGKAVGCSQHPVQCMCKKLGIKLKQGPKKFTKKSRGRYKLPKTNKS